MQSREAGRSAGLAWAADEARRGYLHQVKIGEGQKTRVVIEHARQAFSGLCEGREHSFIRGFVQGVAEFWQAANLES